MINHKTVIGTGNPDFWVGALVRILFRELKLKSDHELMVACLNTCEPAVII